MERMELAADLWEENIKVYKKNVSMLSPYLLQLHFLLMLTFPSLLITCNRLRLSHYLIQALLSNMNMQMSTISSVLSF